MPSLEQAGGLHRMVLRGHSAGINKVMLTPTGTDVVTGVSSQLTTCLYDLLAEAPLLTMLSKLCVVGDLPVLAMVLHIACCPATLTT